MHVIEKPDGSGFYIATLEVFDEGECGVKSLFTYVGSGRNPEEALEEAKKQPWYASFAPNRHLQRGDSGPLFAPRSISLNIFKAKPCPSCGNHHLTYVASQRNWIAVTCENCLLIGPKVGGYTINDPATTPSAKLRAVLTWNTWIKTFKGEKKDES